MNEEEVVIKSMEKMKLFWILAVSNATVSDIAIPKKNNERLNVFDEFVTASDNCSVASFEIA